MSKAFNMSMIMEDKWCGSAAATDPDCEEDEASPEDCSAAELDLSRALSPCHRIRCAAHTLQLAVNGALRKDQASKELLDIVNRVVNLFRRSPLWTGRLKEICSKDLVPATGTRWNSVLAALKRLIQADVFDAVEQLVQEHNETRTGRAIEAVPPIFTQSRLAELQGLLKPLGDATDRLQGDGVTSAILHLCISTCYIQIKTYPAEDFLGLQEELLDQLNERFAPLLEDELLIASSVLNPRQKLRVFQSTLAEGLHKPNAACAVAAVNKLLLHLEEDFAAPLGGAGDREPVATTSGSRPASDVAPQPLWDAHDMYDVLDLWDSGTTTTRQNQTPRQLPRTSTRGYVCQRHMVLYLEARSQQRAEKRVAAAIATLCFAWPRVRVRGHQWRRREAKHRACNVVERCCYHGADVSETV
ncbi:hypothetical protein ISCGN_015996 [Ixodes scapularis]